MVVVFFISGTLLLLAWIWRKALPRVREILLKKSGCLHLMSRWWTLAFSRKIRGNSRSFGVGGKLAADYEAGDVVLDNAYNIHCSAVNETE